MEAPNRLRKPSQARTLERVNRAIAAAERLILERGPEEVSIPDIAEASGVPRASLYQFYANKHQLFAAITERQLARVLEYMQTGAKALAGYHWRDTIPLLIRGVSGHFNQNPVASILILGWPVSRATFQAQGVTVDNIGAAVHDMLLTTTPRIDLSRHPSATTVVVEISFACLKYGYYREGVISEAIQEQAVLAATGYMEQLLPVELRHPAASYVSPTALHAPASA